jgi:valyl-tRNA synthetase
VDLAAERARLETELAESHAQIERLENLLASPFAQKAPPDVVEKEREKLAAYRETAARLKQQLG